MVTPFIRTLFWIAAPKNERVDRIIPFSMRLLEINMIMVDRISLDVATHEPFFFYSVSYTLTVRTQWTFNAHTTLNRLVKCLHQLSIVNKQAIEMKPYLWLHWVCQTNKTSCDMFIERMMMMMMTMMKKRVKISHFLPLSLFILRKQIKIDQITNMVALVLMACVLIHPFFLYLNL